MTRTHHAAARSPLALVRAATAATLVVIALAGCESRLSLGSRCARDGDCAEPYACLLGTCRAECLSDRDCPVGVTCAQVAPGAGACTFETENRCTGSVCPAPLVCEAGRCRASCTTDAECLPSQRCAGAICIARDEPDAGVSVDAGPFSSPRLCATAASCRSGEICSGDFAPSICRLACDDHADCPESSACDYYPTSDSDAGYVEGCSTVCRPGSSEGCAPGTTCRMVFRSGAVRPAGPPSLTQCSPFRAGAVAGCPCDQLEVSTDCEEGFSCEMPPEGRMCLRICEVGDECEPGVLCAMTPRSIVVGGVQYGVCPPPATMPTTCPAP